MAAPQREVDEECAANHGLLASGSTSDSFFSFLFLWDQQLFPLFS